MFQTEYEFDLPKGFADSEGTLQRHGVMRLATARDELDAMKDPRVRANSEYATVILLARVVRSFGTLGQVTPEIIEQLFTTDFQYLQNMYQTINEAEEPVIHVQCPHCGRAFTDTINFCRGE